jgi:peptidoglycan/LPS O-acetylase OafA/YrhL
LRGVAILLVLILHSYGVGIAHRQGFFWHAAQAGWVGVDLFFVLSGYLITAILLGTRGGPNYYSSFFARRFLRIFPPYYLTLAFLLILGAGVTSLRTEGFRLLVEHQAWLWTFTTNIKVTLSSGFQEFGWLVPGASIFNTSHFWSLAVEEQFYWFWPIIVATLAPRRLVWAIAAFAVIAPGLRLYMIQSGNPSGAYVFTLCRMDILSMGALVAWLEHQGQLWRAQKFAPPVIAAALGLLVALSLWRGNYDSADAAVILAGYTLNGVLFAAVLAQVLTSPEGRWTRFFSLGPLRFMGKYSYSVYLIHLIIANPLLLRAVHDLHYVEEKAGSLFAWLSFVFVVTLTGSYAAAFVLWHGVEKRVLSLKRFFPYPAPRNGTSG